MLILILGGQILIFSGAELKTPTTDFPLLSVVGGNGACTSHGNLWVVSGGGGGGFATWRKVFFFFVVEGIGLLDFLFIIIMDNSWILLDVCVLGFDGFSAAFLKNLQGKALNKTG